MFGFYSSQLEVTHTHTDEGKKERKRKWLTICCSNEKENERMRERESNRIQLNAYTSILSWLRMSCLKIIYIYGDRHIYKYVYGPEEK